MRDDLASVFDVAVCAGLQRVRRPIGARPIGARQSLGNLWTHGDLASVFDVDGIAGLQRFRLSLGARQSLSDPLGARQSLGRARQLFGPATT